MNTERVRAEIKRYEAEFARHVLTTLVDTKHVQVYRCGRPETRCMSFQVTFTPEGIAIQGDFTPGGGNGACSRGKSLGWFRSHLEPDYLASKFLDQGWHADAAADWLDDRAREAGAEAVMLKDECPELAAEASKRQFALLHLVEQTPLLESPEAFREAVEDLGIEVDEGPWDYDEGDAAALSAIQRTFARLFDAAEEAEEDYPKCSTCTQQGDPHCGDADIICTWSRRAQP